MESGLADVFTSLHISPQKPPPDVIPENMKAIIQSFPPLGQVTQLKNGKVTLTAVLEVPADLQSESWQVGVWHSTDGGEWDEALLDPVSPGRAPFETQSTSSNTRLFYSTTLTVRNNLQFTLRFRHDESASWRWTRDELGISDGHVIIGSSSTSDLPSNLNDLIQDLDPAWNVKSLMSQASRSRLWSLTTEVPGAVYDLPSRTTLPIGVPFGDYIRWFALIRTWTPWLAPRHGKSRLSLDKDGLLCSFLDDQGHHLVFLALSSVNHISAVFQSDDDRGGLKVHARNDDTSPQQTTVLVAISDSFECANAAVMYHARNVVQIAKAPSPGLTQEIKALEEDIKPEWRENWYDGLGYCTWNALGQKLTEDKIFDAVDKLAESDIKVSSLIIDDNWQSIDYRGNGQFQHGWVEFEAEPKAFPNGLKATVSHIRQKHPHIQHVAVWHALLGYWAGISPDGKLAKTYKTAEVVREDAQRRHLPLGGTMTVVAEEDVDRFYDDFYRFLVSCGVDGVKTDAQFMTDTWTSAAARRRLTDAYLDAWTIASLRHFSIRAISCMSQVPHIIFHSQLPRDRPPVPCRNSDDFFPGVPASHPWHVWSNAHNALLTQHLNVLPDWDMFQTVHDYSGFHAAARCVSGGPIYITDEPGKYDIGLIRQMTGPTTRGKTVTLRPSVVGKSLDAYNDYHDDVLLKVGCYHGAAVTGTGIIGLFNISSRPLTELISLESFPGVISSMKYVVRAHSSGRITAPLSPGLPALILSSLDVRGYDVLTAYPVESFDSEARGRVYAANLGLLRKMTGAAAIMGTEFDLERDGKVRLTTSLKTLGVLGVYISALPELTIDDDFIATIQGRVIPVSTVSISAGDPHVLEIDVEAAWQELGLHAGWGNEVEVKIIFAIDHEESADGAAQ
ncbi:raffinose synthase Sip1 [Plectosphaerella plurivora]|uniref:Raffinose synthase Sip1 n=1 Tax=Plectosphaerella plurivora TaxID=936078 RepID=A0A9P8VJV9_9PEZI|nr:raffinose synthase Sip1 [Plectosphaerella plurivora]